MRILLKVFDINVFMNDQLRETDQLKFKSSSLSSRYEQYQVTSFWIHFIKVGPFC